MRVGVNYVRLMYILIQFKELFVCKWRYSPDIMSFQFGSTMNPDNSIRKKCCDSPWFLAIFRLCFAEDIFFLNWYFICNFVIIVNTSSILALIAIISQ